MALGLTQPLTKMSIRNSSWGVKEAARSAENLTTFMCRLSLKPGASTSWNLQGLSRPVMELLYLYVYIQTHITHCVLKQHLSSSAPHRVLRTSTLCWGRN
jgi:hypothetical protein